MFKKEKLISVIIPTYNRPKKVVDCIKSVLVNTFESFEVILIDRDNSGKTRKEVDFLIPNKIRYFKSIDRVKARVLNFALKKASGKIIAFTDDDCIVDKDWLKNIYDSFQDNKNVIGVFGKVLPFRPREHRGKICPCTFLKNKERVITKPCLHWKNIGFGNNMAFRKEIFSKIGDFKEWLGPGSIGSNAEDAEFALRLLLKGYRLLYTPKIKVYHSRWLTKEEYQRQCLSYSCGEVACYGYFAFQGNGFAKKIVINNFKDSYWKLRRAIKSTLLLKKSGLRLLFHTAEELYFRLRGLIVAFYFSKKDPL